jgi:four helix bundle protein
MQEMATMPSNADTIRARAFQFACTVVAVALQIRPVPGVRSVIEQLVRSATSVGANLEEAKAASTRREFIRFVEISLREARETHYWLRIAVAVKLTPVTTLQPLLEESDQLIRILTVIVLNTKRRGVAVSAFCILNSALLIS